jgi:hypothetical protein
VKKKIQVHTYDAQIIIHKYQALIYVIFSSTISFHFISQFSVRRAGGTEITHTYGMNFSYFPSLAISQSIDQKKRR